ncbi:MULTISPECIES: TM2 domain-containing protein [Staphylococcus]|jgi:TM2 domain-containing membrane protein YozV|uniref:TM2 domain n=1 Tax=Staphylococcus gallinarum TaxID=1293 RepID=A0A0D0SKG2_STAGA|nr:TM2 domain-containing protein [Staphylococcus gallinarum]KIR12895.1 membrane protein [Staphylococcus gallinarum]MBU7218312.1 TM2 domain-containing protein [Staphylococcus gallinarum]MCD8785531.1 TM2 domain-containing protein [Staphylococcus gallinarum]MCD8820452.1 TM2 domain-containing protein [Staphylococcus gallinarum]MCD8826615.1 TM2 domain-containing protein [Staphylococcus gallinarum]
MNIDERAYIEQRVANNSKSTGVAYLLWFFLGGFGAHRFYLGKTGSAVGLLVLTLLTSWWTFGIPTIIWVIIDAFLIPSIIREHAQAERNLATTEVQLMKNK